jgi:hypothetical protein
MSSGFVKREQTAIRKKYVSLTFDGTRWMFPRPLIRFNSASFSSLDPLNRKHTSPIWTFVKISKRSSLQQLASNCFAKAM